MNLKDIVISSALIVVTVWTVQHFFAPSLQNVPDAAHSGQRIVAPQAADIEHLKPINTHVNFIDQKHSKAIQTVIQTDQARYEFSTEGASLERVEFLRNWGGTQSYLATVFPPSLEHKEQRTFLVGLQEHTPFYYELKDHVRNAHNEILTYQARTAHATITKIFTVDKNDFTIQLNLTIEPHNGPMQPRLFFGSPLVAQLGKDDVITALVNKGTDSLQILSKKEDLLQAYWYEPTLFGTQDRYFVHAFVADTHQFARRGYFKVFDLEGLFSILEGPEIKEPTTWSMTFYMGPKIDEYVRAVDARLVETLNYGWLGVISRPVSRFMLDCLNILYDYCKNYGVAIIILTLLMRLFLLPLSWPMIRGRKKQEDWNRKLKYVEEKFKHDPEALQKARAEIVMKQMGGMLGGCLPLLAQLPPAVALSWVLSNAIELYKAPFLWISDLSARDPYFILPILVGIALWYFYSQNPDPRQKAMGGIMALISTAFFAYMSSGLLLYIFLNLSLGALQQKFFK